MLEVSITLALFSPSWIISGMHVSFQVSIVNPSLPKAMKGCFECISLDFVCGILLGKF